MDHKELLAKISTISEKYDLLYKETGGYFNIFEVANLAENEVAICRVLQELLSPAGSHYQGYAYLKLFFQHVLDMDIPNAELQEATVSREYLIKGNRRIDLVIETSDFFIPIEVKIYAADQDKQCSDYYKAAKKHMQNPRIYYLTLDGSDPDECSKGDLSDFDIIKLSFSNHILEWLNLCLKEAGTIKVPPIREIIIQLIGAIRKLTGRMEDKKEMEVTNLLMASPENMRSAVEIQNAIDEARTKKMNDLFEAIEDRVQKEKLKKLDNEYDYTQNNKVASYYSKKSSTYPGISYPYKNKTDSDREIWVRLEIDHRIFVGYCSPVDGKWTKDTLSDEEICKALHIEEPRVDNWWADWEYLPDGNESTSPNFKSHNDAYYALYDQQNFDLLVKKCAEKIKKLLEK